MENKGTRKYIVLGFLTFLLVIGYFIYQEFNPNITSKISGKNIGSIHQVNKDVRQKHAKNINWQELRKSSELFLGDSVFTGEQSTAEVAFINGSKMIIQANSLIVFNQIGEDLNLDLQQGTVRTVVNENNSPVRLKIQGKSVKLSSKDAEVVIDSKGEVQLSKGDVDIKSEIPLQKINSDLSVTKIEPEPIESLVDTKNEPEPIQEKTPNWAHENNQIKAVFSFNSDEEPIGQHIVTLKWLFPEEATFNLEMSTTENFEKIDYQQELTMQEHAIQKIKPGKYFARVKKKESKLWSQALSIDISNQYADLPPEPKLLTKKINLQLPNKTVEKIKWQADYANYQLEISDNSNFKNPEIINQSSTEYNFQFKSFDTTFYRVSGVTKKGKKSAYSEIGIINSRVDAPNIEPLTDKNLTGLNPEDRPKKIDVNIPWTSWEKVTNFKLQISNSPDFKGANEIFLNQTSHNFSTDQVGDYYFRVQAVNQNKVAISNYSEPRKLSYTFTLPSLALPKVISPKNNFTVFSQLNSNLNYTFSWTPVYQAESYLFELSNDSNFEQVVYKQESKKDTVSIAAKAPNGKLFWRIKAINSLGKSSSWTEAQPLYFYNGRTPAKAEDE